MRSYSVKENLIGQRLARTYKHTVKHPVTLLQRFKQLLTIFYIYSVLKLYKRLSSYFRVGILSDKTMADKLMYKIHKITPSVHFQLVVETFGHSTYEPTNENLLKVSKVNNPTLGTIVINSPMSSLFLISELRIY